MLNKSKFLSLEKHQIFSINVHGSFLPYWRGASPINQVIFSRDTFTGVSIIKMSEELDAGPILRQEKMILNHTETFGSLHQLLSELGAKNLLQTLNNINSKTGIKPGNLIGSKSLEGHTNLAIFSSVVHLGSHPALIGFFLRPSTKIRRDTYENILETGSYTINHIDKRIIEKAHYSSVKFSSYVSEFEKLKLTEQYVNDFYAPYLLESKIKIGLSFVEEVDVKINGTKLIIGEIRHIYLPENIMSEEGYLNLEKSASVGIGGLNSYYNLNFNAEFPYARIENLPNFDED